MKGCKPLNFLNKSATLVQLRGVPNVCMYVSMLLCCLIVSTYDCIEYSYQTTSTIVLRVSANVCNDSAGEWKRRSETPSRLGGILRRLGTNRSKVPGQWFQVLPLSEQCPS